MGEWPWQENETDRLRRILHHYRNALLEECPTRCLTVDELMFQYGQEWITDDSVIDVNEYVTAKQIWQRFGISDWNIRDWARRNPDEIRTRKVGGKRLFLLGDILRHQARR